MATDLSTAALPYSKEIASVSGAEVITISSLTQLVQVRFDHADGGTATLGGGDAVPVDGNKWEPVWIAPRSPFSGTTTLTVTPTTTCDVHVRVS